MTNILTEIKKLLALLKNENRLLNKRAKRAKKSNFKRALKKVADVEPDE